MLSYTVYALLSDSTPFLGVMFGFKTLLSLLIVGEFGITRFRRNSIGQNRLQSSPRIAHSWRIMLYTPD